MISQAALKVVHILTSKYAQVSVDQVRFRELVEKLGEGRISFFFYILENHSDDAIICEAFEKEFIDESKRKSNFEGDENALKKLKTSSSHSKESTQYDPEDMTRYNQ